MSISSWLTTSTYCRTANYRPDIDGLRAVAILPVVFYHCGFACFRGGFIGVDIFFVISGYLIGSMVVKDILGGSFSISRFYERRAKRILPALFSILIFSYLAALLLLSPAEMKDFAKTAFATIASSSNILFFLRRRYFAVSSEQIPLLMTWSLGVEEQFYLLFPVLMLLLRKLPWRIQVAIVGGLALLSLIFSVVGTNIMPNATFYLLPARAWELATGILLAMLEVRRSHVFNNLQTAVSNSISVLGLILIVVGVVGINASTPFPGYAALLPVSGTAAIIAARQGIVNRFLTWRPIVFVGLVSYSWYLWHWPLLSFSRICSDSGISRTTAIVVVLVSFGCAIVSWRFIERPLRKSDTPTPILLRRYAALACAMTIPVIVFLSTGGLPQRERSVQKMEDSAELLHHDACSADYGVSLPTFVAPCVPLGGERAVALIGDSHAAQLAPWLRSFTADHGYKLIELAKSSCAPFKGVTPYSVHHPAHDLECKTFNSEVLSYITRNRNINVVIIAGDWSGYLHDGRELDGFALVPDQKDSGKRQISAPVSLLFSRGLDGEITELEHNRKVVYLLQDNNHWDFDPMRHMRARLIAPRKAIAQIVGSYVLRPPDGIALPPESMEETEARRLVALVANNHPLVKLIDLRNALCSLRGCRFALDKKTLFVDSHHLSPVGAEIALSGLMLP